jgi:hypothetical protein
MMSRFTDLTGMRFGRLRRGWDLSRAMNEPCNKKGGQS